MELDLHGVRHDEVDAKVENFILMNQDKFPLNIVCGNSHKMIELVKKTTKRIGCETIDLRYGVVTVRRFT